MNALKKEMAEFLNIVSDPIRLDIIYKLKHEKKNSGDFEEELGISQSYTSKQLNMLHDAGIINFTRDENRVKTYFIEKDKIFRILSLIKSFVIEVHRDRFEKMVQSDHLDTIS